MHAPTAAAAAISSPSSSPDDIIDEKVKTKEDLAESLESSQQDTDAGLNEISAPPKSKFSQYKTKAINAAMHGLRQDVRNLDSDHLKEVHAAAILYDDDAEYLFSFLQILTACMASFAHGSNDVANAVGPLASIFGTWQTATVDVSGKVPVPIWILAYGGVAIDIGLLTLGYRVNRLIF
jgi:sodium-dependent phosphate transporter